MKIGNIYFSEKGIKEFEKLTKKQQTEYLIVRKNPQKKIKQYLKGVKYGKLQRSEKKGDENKQPSKVESNSSEDNT